MVVDLSSKQNEKGFDLQQACREAVDWTEEEDDQGSQRFIHPQAECSALIPAAGRQSGKSIVA
jgi:hypothetical protein